MKKIMSKVQEIGKKAGEFKAAIDALPGKAAQIRETITMTAGELQQIKSSVQSTLQGLTATSEGHLLKAMKDINDHEASFEEAGYRLTDLEMDLGMAQRLSVHLKKIEDVSHSHLKNVLSGQSNPSIRSIIGGIIQAEETVANVDLPGLHYNGLVIHVGPLPLIRLSWLSESQMQEATAISQRHETIIPQPGKSLLDVPTESFFERRVSQAPVAATPSAAITPAVSTPLSTAPAPTKTSQWAKDSLDRFKKMPSGSKY